MADFIKPYVEKLDKAILDNPTVDKLLTTLEQKTKVKKVYIGYGIIAAVVSWLMFGFGAQLLCNAIGYIYPAYCSIKALESRNKNDDTQWLVYWVVYALFSVVEFFSDILVGWVPFYWLMKCVFLVWLMSPMDGSSTIYNRIILPAFRKNEGAIDNVINTGKSKFAGLGDAAITEASRIATEVESKKLE